MDGQTNLIDNPYTSWEYSFYTIIPDGWQWDLTTNTQKFPYIVDSGTTLCYLPPGIMSPLSSRFNPEKLFQTSPLTLPLPIPAIADAINAAFEPAAVYLWMYGAYFTACDARAPILAVILKGVRFYFNPVDLMYQDMVDPITGLCMTGIASGGTGPYILGDVFLQNALAIFDVGRSSMRFFSRQFY